MKKLIKQTILALATITCLSLAPIFTQNVNAIGAGAALGVVVGSGLNINDQDAIQELRRQFPNYSIQRGNGGSI